MMDVTKSPASSRSASSAGGPSVGSNSPFKFFRNKHHSSEKKTLDNIENYSLKLNNKLIVSVERDEENFREMDEDDEEEEEEDKKYEINIIRFVDGQSNSWFNPNFESQSIEITSCTKIMAFALEIDSKSIKKRKGEVLFQPTEGSIFGEIEISLDSSEPASILITWKKVMNDSLKVTFDPVKILSLFFGYLFGASLTESRLTLLSFVETLVFFLVFSFSRYYYLLQNEQGKYIITEAKISNEGLILEDKIISKKLKLSPTQTSVKIPATVISTEGSTTTSQQQKVIELRSRLSDLEIDPEKCFAQICDSTFFKSWELADNLYTTPEWKDKAIESCKKRISSDDFLLRYLRSEKFDIEKSETFVRKSLAMRCTLDLDTFPERFRLPLSEYCLSGASHHSISKLNCEEGSKFRLDHGCIFDKEGNYTQIFKIGIFPVKAYYKAIKPSPIIMARLILVIMEMYQQDLETLHSNTMGKVSTKANFVFDLKNFSIKNQISPYQTFLIVKLAFPVLIGCYPDMVKRLLLINVPTVFASFWNRLIRPFVSPSLKDKIVMTSADSEGLKSILLKYFYETEIPKCYGGTLVGVLPPFQGDENCLDKVGPVGPFLEANGVNLLDTS